MNLIVGGMIKSIAHFKKKYFESDQYRNMKIIECLQEERDKARGTKPTKASSKSPTQTHKQSGTNTLDVSISSNKAGNSWEGADMKKIMSS
jgi:hypothetical protein